ncbi:MAG TPA: phosphoribosylaminoimidazolesuccinocarboxamide synthase [Gemmataceae bacterium]|nr:phosphoribosylaminoimidazolesuccinocarboxamide synthase [Gemmataceae bacterium]
MTPALFRSDIPGLPCRRGKVRDVYDFGDRLVIVATDRLSAFDWVLPTPIPGKGRLLTQLSLFWFDRLAVPNHLLNTDLAEMGRPFADRAEELAGRTMLVRKANVVPFECVVRGYLAGSGWAEYRRSGKVCGVSLPPGLRESERLPEPIFTPATKAEAGHDENVHFDVMAGRVGGELAGDLRNRSLDVYGRAARHAAERGIILADTKFEWGLLPDGSVILIDEVLTPDSSRFWPADQYRVGSRPPSFDKQFVRDWLEASGWDKQSPPPELPVEIVERTAAKYQEAFDRLTA